MDEGVHVCVCEYLQSTVALVDLQGKYEGGFEYSQLFESGMHPFC